MAFKSSAVLSAAMLALALPAFAQNAATDMAKDIGDAAANGATEAVEAAGQALKDAGDKAADTAKAMVQDGKDAAADAAGQAVEAVTDAADEAAADVSKAMPATTPAAEATAEVAAEVTDAPAAPVATETAADDAPATEAPATAAPAAADDTAAAADAEPQTGAYYIRTTHKDWTIRCIKAAEGADPCELYQLLKDEQGNSVAEMTLIPLGDKIAAGATLIAPLETDLMQGIGLRVDQGKGRAYPFNFCAPVGCVSRMGFTPAELSQFKRGNTATVNLLPFGADPKQPVALAMSLSGFTAAYDELAGIVAEQKAAAGN